MSFYSESLPGRTLSAQFSAMQQKNFSRMSLSVHTQAGLSALHLLVKYLKKQLFYTIISAVMFGFIELTHIACSILVLLLLIVLSSRKAAHDAEKHQYVR